MRQCRQDKGDTNFTFYQSAVAAPQGGATTYNAVPPPPEYSRVETPPMNQNAGANGLPPAIPGPEIAQTHPTANAEALRGPAANDPLLAMDCDSIHKTEFTRSDSPVRAPQPYYMREQLDMIGWISPFFL